MITMENKGKKKERIGGRKGAGAKDSRREREGSASLCFLLRMDACIPCN